MQRLMKCFHVVIGDMQMDKVIIVEKLDDSVSIGKNEQLASHLRCVVDGV